MPNKFAYCADARKKLHCGHIHKEKYSYLTRSLFNFTTRSRSFASQYASKTQYIYTLKFGGLIY